MDNINEIRFSGTIELLKSVNIKKGTTMVTLLPLHLISAVTSIMPESRPNDQLQICN